MRKPSIPSLQGIAPDLMVILQPIKELMELFMGQRGVRTDQALTRADAQVDDVPFMTATVAAANPPTKVEFDALVADVTAIRTKLNALLSKMR